MSETSKPKAEAGWYPHPKMADTQRYWDGERWTDHIAPASSTAATSTPVTASSAAESTREGDLVKAAWIMVVIFPIGGFIAGVVLLSRRPGMGMAVMLCSVLSAFIWYGIFFHESELECLTENLDRAEQGIPTRDCS